MQTENMDYGARPQHELIGSDRVEGTPVFSSDGERLGMIERVMIDKLSGKVAYAVMSVTGSGYYPVPWSLLTYNTTLGGYEVNISVVQLQGAPKFEDSENWDYPDQE